MNGISGSKRATRSFNMTRGLGELFIIGGASLVMIFLIIPSQTSPGAELGLSPQLLPTVCSALIGLLALTRFIAIRFRASAAARESERVPVYHALGIVGATMVGIVAIVLVGWPVGSAILAVLVALMLGERRPYYLVALSAGVAALLYLIQLTGI